MKTNGRMDNKFTSYHAVNRFHLGCGKQSVTL